MSLSDAAILKPVQDMHEARRLARHAIRKAFEAARDYTKASGTPGNVESCSLELREFTICMEERAEKGFDRL